MKRVVLLSELLVLIGTVIAAFAFISWNASGRLTTPDHAVSFFLNSAGSGNFDEMRQATTTAWAEDFIGHFGEAKYRRVRDIYQKAVDLGEPHLQEIRNRALAASNSDYQAMHQRVDELGRGVFAQLSSDKKMALTADRAQFDEFVFHEGFRGLPAADRALLGSEAEFRAGSDRAKFAQHVGWGLLSADDRQALGSPAALSTENTSEKIEFLVKTGRQLLTAEERNEISSIYWTELNDPRAFMLKYGEPLARAFLRNVSLSDKGTDLNCKNIDLQSGSLISGTVAVCSNIATRGRESLLPSTVVLLKRGFDWQIDGTYPEFYNIPSAHPVTPNYSEARTPTLQQPYETAEQRVVFPEARWQPHAPLEVVTAVLPLAMTQGLLSKLGLKKVVPVTMVAIVLLPLAIFVMTVNYRRNRNANFVPDWLDTEHEISAVSTGTIWGRMHARLTDRRLLQLKINWFLSRRKLFAIAFEDVHAVVWHQQMNWLLFVLALAALKLYLPAAILLVMLGLEAKVYSVRLVGTQYAQFPTARLAVSSFHRNQFRDLFDFYRNVQRAWARVRASSAPVSTLVPPVSAPDIDHDFYWGRATWVYVLLISGLAFVQGLIGNVAFADYFFAPLYLAFPVAAAVRSRKTGFWVATLGMVMLLTIKTQSAFLLQYPEAFLIVILIAVAAGRTARASTALGILFPCVWIAFVAYQSTVLVQDFALFSRIALASATAVLICWIDRMVSSEHPEPALSAKARGAVA